MDGNLTGTTIPVLVDFGVMTMKEQSTLSRATELEPRYLMQFSVKPETSLSVGTHRQDANYTKKIFFQIIVFHSNFFCFIVEGGRFFIFLVFWERGGFHQGIYKFIDISLKTILLKRPQWRNHQISW